MATYFAGGVVTSAPLVGTDYTDPTYPFTKILITAQVKIGTTVYAVSQTYQTAAALNGKTFDVTYIGDSSVTADPDVKIISSFTK